MSEYFHSELEKVIREQEAKIQLKITSLQHRYIQRERLESEIVELKSDIEKAEDFIKLVQGIQNTTEDQLICAGIKAQRKIKRDKRISDKS